jgi:hypothetical protein
MFPFHSDENWELRIDQIPFTLRRYRGFSAFRNTSSTIAAISAGTAAA